MGEVAGTEHADALAHCPGREVRGMPQALLQARENFEWMCRSAWNIAVFLAPLS